MGKQLCAGNPNAAGQTYGRTDRRTWWFQYTPPNFVAGGIIIVDCDIKQPIHLIYSNFSPFLFKGLMRFLLLEFFLILMFLSNFIWLIGSGKILDTNTHGN